MKNKIVNHVFIFTVIVFLTTFFIVFARNNTAYALAENIVEYNLIDGLFNATAIMFLCIPVIVKLGLKEKIGLNSCKNIRKSFRMLSIIVFAGLCYSGIMYISCKHTLIQFQGIGMLLSLIFMMLTTGFMEEFGIRGILLQIYVQKWGENKKGIVWAAFFSSFLFGLQHIFSSIVQYLRVAEMTPETIMQTIFRVFFSTTFGFLCAIVILDKKNIWSVAIIHGVYDFLLSSHYLYLQPSIAYMVSLNNGFSGLFGENNIINKGNAEILFFSITAILEAIWAIILCYRMDMKKEDS